MLSTMARGTRSPARLRTLHPLLPALVAVVVSAVLVAVVAAGGDDEPAATPATSSTTGPTTTVPPPPTSALPDPQPAATLLVASPEVAPLSAYRMTYEVVENGLPRVEEWTVRRPYESLVLSTRDGVLLSGTSTSRARLQNFLSNEDGWLPIQPELHRAAFDQHAAAAVGAMEVLGLVERRGEEEHLGRACTVWRTGQAPSAGAPTRPTDDAHTDVCIDGAGLVLHERWEIGGNVVLERTATALELEPAVDPAVFDPGPVVRDAEALTAAFSTIAVPADEETLARLQTDVAVPDGYGYDGAVFRGAGGGPGGGGGGSPASAETVRFYSRGADLLEVAEVFTGGGASLASGPAVRVAVEGWDEVWFEPGFRMSMLRARLDDVTYVEVRHHDVSFLFEVLSSLRRVDR